VGVNEKVTPTLSLTTVGKFYFDYYKGSF